MSSEIVLKLNVIVLLFSMFVNKHSLEVFAEEARVGCQVKLKMSTFKNKKRKKTLKLTPPEPCILYFCCFFSLNISHKSL